MTVKSDRWIRLMAEEHKLIDPFNPTLVREVEGRRIISAGDEDSLVEPPLRTAEDGSRYHLLPPHSYALGVTVETFRMPRNVTGICMGKSTYARAGLLVNTTPLEAGWQGRLVIELGNLADLPIRVYVNEGIGQVLFFESDEACEISYDEKKGKYLDQVGVVPPRL